MHRIKIGLEEILSGQIWIGTEAVRIGIADELGTETDAFNKAAELARVAHFKTIDLRNLAETSISPYPFFLQSPDGVNLPYPTESGMYMLFIPQLPIKQ